LDFACCVAYTEQSLDELRALITQREPFLFNKINHFKHRESKYAQFPTSNNVCYAFDRAFVYVPVSPRVE